MLRHNKRIFFVALLLMAVIATFTYAAFGNTKEKPPLNYAFVVRGERGVLEQENGILTIEGVSLQVPFFSSDQYQLHGSLFFKNFFDTWKQSVHSAPLDLIFTILRDEAFETMRVEAGEITYDDASSTLVIQGSYTPTEIITQTLHDPMLVIESPTLFSLIDAKKPNLY